MQDRCGLPGTLHVSLPSDIIQLFGKSSVPAIVAGSVLGVFELGERFASQRAKDALSKWLLTFDVRKAGVLPEETRELFEGIFGERHFSLKCFFRSVAFSLGAMTFITILRFVITPKDVLFEVSGPNALIGLTFEFLALWLFWSIIIDYLSLFKTRVILRIMIRIQVRPLIAIAILVMDFYLYFILFIVGFTLVGIVPIAFMAVPDWPLVAFIFNSAIDTIRKLFLSPVRVLLISFEYFTFKKNVLEFITFWAGLVPSIWMWLYVLALFATRGLLRSERIVNWLRWALDVEKNPFRSIGAVAATLAFIVSVAIILVSAEVSRIGAAS